MAFSVILQDQTVVGQPLPPCFGSDLACSPRSTPSGQSLVGVSAAGLGSFLDLVEM
jgi:hypothetical protein